jgi:diguanylate cyclase (GGDEF)-like protein
MNALIALSDAHRLTAHPVAAPQPADTLPEAQVVALPGVSQFAAVMDLIKSVLGVPAVTVALHGAPGDGERGVFRSFLEIPLLRQGRAIGSLRVLDTIERQYDERDCLLLEGFARLIVEQVDMWSEASRDVLTGAMTRRAFQDVLHKSFAARQRQSGDAALILFDLDHFKRINDTLGHAAGDAVLRATARAVLRELRVEDSFGRVGGEEFAILLSNTDPDRAAEVAERVRHAVARMIVPNHPDLAVTASFGVVGLDDSTPSPQALMDAADAALYAAKSGGRNRVERGAA